MGLVVRRVTVKGVDVKMLLKIGVTNFITVYFTSVPHEMRCLHCFYLSPAFGVDLGFVPRSVCVRFSNHGSDVPSSQTQPL